MVKDGGHDSLCFVVNTINLDKKNDFVKLILKIACNMFSIKDKKKIIFWENDTLIHNRFGVAFSRILCKSYLDTMQYIANPDYMINTQEIFRWYITKKYERRSGYGHILRVEFKENMLLNDGGIMFYFDEREIINCNIKQ